MRIVATSDFHGSLPVIPECDLLLIAGDITPVTNHAQEYQANWLRQEFAPWLDEQPAEHKVWIAGNHDLVLMKPLGATLIDPHELPGTYLRDSVTEVDGVKIFGSPYTPKFGNWAFMMPDGMLREKWASIPDDVDIIMIHGPAWGVNDYAWGENVGSATLRNIMTYRGFPKLKLFVCGHIHEGYGMEIVKTKGTEWIEANVSYVDADYIPGNPPMRFSL